MYERTARRGPNWALLLLVPAALMVAKGVRRRRAMWNAGWTPAHAAGHGYGHHRRFGREGDAAVASFRLPPRIESMLDAWHTRVHEKAEPTDPTAPQPETI